MTKRKLTPLEAAQRMLRRDDQRRAREARTVENQTWLHQRAREAKDRSEVVAKEREKARTKRLSKKTAAGRVPKKVRDIDKAQAKKGVTYAQVGVSAVDGKKDSGTKPKQRSANRKGRK